MLWKAKEKASRTDSAVRDEMHEGWHRARTQPSGEKGKGKETIEAGSGLGTHPCGALRVHIETCKSQKCHSGWQTSGENTRTWALE